MPSSILGAWKFDLKTAVVTVVVAPLLLYFLALLRRYLKNWIGYVLEGLMYWLSRFLRRSLAGAMTLKRYCRMRLADENRYLFVPSSLDVKLEIDEVFVTLTLDDQGGKGATHDHRNVLTVGNRIRVIGDPGSGKSSLVKRLFRDACYRALTKPSKARLPLLVELKDLPTPGKQFDGRLGDWFLKRLRDAAARSKVYQMEECFDTYAENAGLLVLLDGLDEVSTPSYPRIQSAIIALSQRLAQIGERSIIVLTMRTQFHQQVRESFRDSFGKALFLKPFTPSDIYDFLTRWPFGSGREHTVARIYGELTDRPTLREMCSNPLILAMYVAEDQAAGHVVAPESRTEFYAKVTEELLIKRRLQQTGPAPAHTQLREQREGILGRLAYEHMLDIAQPTNSLNWKDAIRVVQHVMRCSERDAEAVFRDIAKETGLITEERAAQTFRFIHLTFCEFLAAYEAVQGQHDGWRTLVDYHRTFQQDASQPQLGSRLLEVIPFAAGLTPRVRRQTAIFDVGALGDDALLARCFLETKGYDHHLWPTFVARQKSALLATPENEWDDTWLRDLHLFNVVTKDAAACAPHMAVRDAGVDLDEFFQSLVGNQKRSLAKLLAAYAAQDAAAAFRLADMTKLNLAAGFPDIVVTNCDQAPFLALVLERALADSATIEQWAPLLTEAGLRSRPVAEGIAQANPAESLRDCVRAVPRRRRWFRTGLVAQTPYTQLLTVAVNSDTGGTRALLYLNVLRTVAAPGAVRVNPLMLELCLMTAAVAGLLSIVLMSLKWKASAAPSNVLMPLLVAIYLLLGVAMVVHLRATAYRVLLWPSRGGREPEAPFEFVSGLLPLFVLNRALRRQAFLLVLPAEMRKALNTLHVFRRGRLEGVLPQTSDARP